jgi:hypothetical protein
LKLQANPVVYGYYNVGAEKTIIVYFMYDTQPVDEPGWIVPPLEGRVVEMEPFGKCLCGEEAPSTQRVNLELSLMLVSL